MILAVIQSSIILMVALCALPFLRRQSAATKHMVLTIGLIAALAVPALTPLIPSWRLSGSIGNIGTRIKTDIKNAIKSVGAGVSRSRLEEAPSQLLQHAPARAGGSRRATDRVSAAFVQQSEVPSSGTIALGIWLSGVGSAGLLILAGASRIMWFVFQSKHLTSGEWRSAVVDVSRALNLKRPIRLVQNEHTVLGTWGFLHPRVLLPRDADSWSSDRLRVVLTHEFAHIKRFDWLVQMLAELARAVYWFNPLFWIACRRLRSESEHACGSLLALWVLTSVDKDLANDALNSVRQWRYKPTLLNGEPVEVLTDIDVEYRLAQ